MSYASASIAELPLGAQAKPLRFVSGTLLPPNATQLEVSLSKTLASLSDIPVEIDRLNQAYACPAKLLPWLAWSLNVDDWQSDYTEDTQRGVIAAAISNHWKKGTKAAVAQALDTVGITGVIQEWFDQTPNAAPGTFKITLFAKDNVTDTGETQLTDARVNRALTLIDRVKRLSQQYTFEIGLEFKNTLALASQARAVQMFSWSYAA
jgi:phage tail P2-like protein